MERIVEAKNIRTKKLQTFSVGGTQARSDTEIIEQFNKTNGAKFSDARLLPLPPDPEEERAVDLRDVLTLPAAGGGETADTTAGGVD